MANQRIYSITINGITESIKAIDALNASLSKLEEKIKSLEAKTVNIQANASTSSSGGGSRSSSNSSLSEEEKLQKQIAQLEEKRIAHSKEIYQNYLAAKDVLKETEKDQKQIAANERLAANSYSNTISGMNQELADIKQAMQTVDLGDGDQLKKMTERANELNSKLKEIEESYGSFGRNVGNYASAAEGFNKLKVTVGNTVREFNSAREASRTLNNELKTMAANGQTDTTEFKNLRQAVMQLESSMNDAKKPMDDLMDAMESFTAIASIGQGISALFGIDDTEIQRSIQKLVALQNIMRGIEAINKQFNTREGIGKYLGGLNQTIDVSTKKLLVYNRAILGTGTASKAAAVGIKVFSKALKLAFSAGILLVVDLLFEGIMKLVEGFNKVDEAAEREKEVQKELANAYGDAQGKLIKYKTVVDNFNGSKKEEKRIVEELNREFGSTLGTYKSLAEWQDVLKRKGDAYIQTIINQAKAQAALNEVTAAYMNLEDVKQKAASGEYKKWYQSQQQDAEAAARAIESAQTRISDAEEKLANTIKENEKFAKENGLGDYSTQIRKNGQKSVDAVKQVQEEINRKKIQTMKDGLNKTIMQLNEEERQTLAKIKGNGSKTALAIKQVQETYTQLRLKAITDYLTKLTKEVEESSKKIAGVKFELSISEIELQIKDLEEDIRHMTEDINPVINTLLTGKEFELNFKGVDAERLDFAKEYLFNKAKSEKNADEYKKWLENYLSTLSKELQDDLSHINVGTGEKVIDYEPLEKFIKDSYNREILLLDSYGDAAGKSLTDSFNYRLEALRNYDFAVLNEVRNTLIKEQTLREKAAKKEIEKLYKKNDEEYRIEYNALNQQAETIKEGLEAIEKLKAGGGSLTAKEQKEYDKLKNLQTENNRQMEILEQNHADKMAQIEKQGKQKLKEINVQFQNDESTTSQNYYDSQLTNFRDFISKINDVASQQPERDKLGFGVVNIAATKRNYKEVLDAAKITFDNIRQERERLSADFRQGIISPEVYNATLTELNNLETEIKNIITLILGNLKNLGQTFMQSISQYIQAGFDSLTTIMDALWDAEDVRFDKEQEQLDKESDMIKEALDKQQDLVEEYKSSIDSIEDELANSRGDRRQHLIDQLNQEIEAERAAYKEKQRLEKLEEANKKKQEALEKKRRKAEYERNLIQAIVNGAMAVTYASMNSWPIPAIPLMALAGATTAAQIAIMASNKPYAKGGQLEGGLAVGPRHRDGGIPVLGGRASIEGGEYVVNRLTTQKNVDLLGYVNSKKKKIDLNDMIEFYSSGSVKKNIINMSPKKHFEDGGYIPPVLSNNIDLDDRLLTAFDSYSRRPVVVDVRDITNKQNDVQRVKVLAGL